MFLLKKRTENIKIENVKKDWLYAPVSGKVIPLEQVNDAVFSQKIMGDGIAIEPEESMLYAPVQGVISVVFPTKHVIGMKAENGADIIIHVGIDTVELKGKGFDVCVKQGDVVRQGQLLMKMDLQTIREDYAATVMITIENSDEYHLAFTEQERVRAGQELMRVERA